VQSYNLTIREFPTLLTARVMGYQPRAQYGLDKADQVMRDPEVRFDLPGQAK
jgi:LemA protein